MNYFNSKLTVSQFASRALLSLCLAIGAIAPAATAQTSDSASTHASGDRVFTLNSHDYYGSEIYLTRPDTSQPLQLTNNSGFDSHPVWSPDGTKIAFQRAAVMGQTDIWVMNADGSNPVNLTNTPNQIESEQSPAWSPDGSRIAFVSTSGSSNWQVWVMNADGSEARRLVNNSLTTTRSIAPVPVGQPMAQRFNSGATLVPVTPALMLPSLTESVLMVVNWHISKPLDWQKTPGWKKIASDCEIRRIDGNFMLELTSGKLLWVLCRLMSLKG